MNNLENRFSSGRGLSAGGALGVLGALPSKLARGVVWPLARGLLKNGIKGGILAYEGVCAVLTGTRDTIEELAAEANSEVGKGAGRVAGTPSARKSVPAPRASVGAPKRARKAAARPKTSRKRRA